MTEKNFVDVVQFIHTQVREKIVFWKGLLPILDRDDIWSDVKQIIDFFNNEVVEHFKIEESMITIAKKNPKNTDGELKVMEEILEEHALIRQNLKGLNEIYRRFDNFDRDIKGSFIETSHKIIDMIVKHAEKEDKDLFPVLRKKISSNDLSKIKKNIS